MFRVWTGEFDDFLMTTLLVDVMAFQSGFHMIIFNAGRGFARIWLHEPELWWEDIISNYDIGDIFVSIEERAPEF